MYKCKPGLQALMVLFASATLAGCAAQMTGGPHNAPAHNPASAARKAAIQGDYGHAAHAYMEAASQAGNASARQQYRFEAGLAAAQAGEAKQAHALLSKIDPSQLNATDQARYNLARREIDIANMPPGRALSQLPTPAPDTAPAVAQRVWEKRAQLYFAAHEPIKGIQSLVRRDAWLKSDAALKANDNHIYDKAQDAIGLGVGPKNAAAQGAGPTTRGWLALAQIGQQQFASKKARNKAIAQWQQTYPGHPANRSVLVERFGYKQTVAVQPAQRQYGSLGHQGKPKVGSKQIAIALPMSGAFKNAAQAIRDGFLFAYQNDSGGLPKPQVIDSSDTGADQLAYQASRDHVGVLVGPLDKSRVASMATVDLPMPEIALNTVDNGQPGPGFYQFGLAPEDEARSVATHAVGTGYKRALALVPDDDWGHRVLAAFDQSLSARGGTVVASRTYNAQSQDHSQTIQKLLSNYSDGSNIDFIFVAAQPEQARLIRSQLKYYRAGGLPMITTSHAYAGKPEPARDVDLNDVRFVDMPWLLAQGGTVTRLRAEADRAYGKQATDYPRLFALGMDAWLLARRVDQGHLSPKKPLEGMTGVLSLQPDGHIRRYLGWAMFRDGQPKTLSLPSPKSIETAKAQVSAAKKAAQASQSGQNGASSAGKRSSADAGQSTGGASQ